MNATRRRDAALVAAALFLVAAILLSPVGRPLARRAALHFGLIAAHHAVREGQPLPTLALTTLDGSTASFVPPPGRRVLVNVFATWCVPCRDETPALARALPELHRAGVTVIGIDQAESGDAVRRFATVFGLRYPLYIDASGSARSLLGARVIPTTVLTDSRGIVRFVHVGPLDGAAFLALAKGTLAER